MKSKVLCVTAALVFWGFASSATGQFQWDYPLGGTDYVFSWNDIHNLYWQIRPFGENLLTGIDQMCVRSSSTDESSDTYYFLLDRTNHRLVTLRADSWNASATSYGKFFGPSTLGLISDMEVVSDFVGVPGPGALGRRHEVFLCDETSQHVRKLNYEISGGDEVWQVTDQFASGSLTNPWKVAHIEGSDNLVFLSRSGGLLQIVDKLGTLIASFAASSILPIGVQPVDIDAWQGWDGTYYLAVAGTSSSQDVVCVVSSPDPAFATRQPYGAPGAIPGPIVQLEYEPHIGLVVAHGNGDLGYLAVLTNVGTWETGFFAGVSGLHNFRCIATDHGYVHVVSALVHENAGISRAKFYGATSVSAAPSRITAELEPVEVHYRINYPGTYSLRYRTVYDGQVHYSNALTIDTAVGEHVAAVNLNQVPAAAFSVQFILTHSPSFGGDYVFQSDWVSVVHGPDITISSPAVGFRIYNGRKFNVTYDLQYGASIDAVHARLFDETGWLVYETTTTAVSVGQQTCELDAPFREWPCGIARTYSVQIQAVAGAYSRANNALSVVYYSDECPPPPPDPNISTRLAEALATGLVPTIMRRLSDVDQALGHAGLSGLRAAVYDLRGRRILSGAVGQLADDDLPTGVYFVALEGARPTLRITILK